MKSKYSAIILVIVNFLFYLIKPKLLLNYGIIIFLFGVFTYFYNRHLMNKVWSIEVEKKDKLVSSGFFKYIRHPLYLGTILMVIGIIILTNNNYLIIMLIIDIFYVYLRARIEEELLIKTLRGYKNYMKNTKMFIPYIF